MTWTPHYSPNAKLTMDGGRIADGYTSQNGRWGITSYFSYGMPIHYLWVLGEGQANVGMFLSVREAKDRAKVLGNLWAAKFAAAKFGHVKWAWFEQEAFRQLELAQLVRAS